MKTILIVIAAIVLAIGVAFTSTEFSLWWKGHFKPKAQTIEHNTFKESTSFVHGKNAALANYYRQYQQAETQDDKETIRIVIQTEFSAFDAKGIESALLRQFLINQRGY